MKSGLRLLTIAPPAAVVFVAAFVVQSTPVAAHRNCRHTPVVVSGTFWDRSHAWGLARSRWSDCVRRVYGEGWTDWEHGAAKVFCHNARLDYQIHVTCPSWDNHRRWVCYFKATPCRWRWHGKR